MPNQKFKHGQARAEARSFFIAATRQHGGSVDSVREEICLDPDSRRILRNFVATHPSEEVWVYKAMVFRDRVLQEFDRLVRRRGVSLEKS